jgi:hypothetical protein
VTNAGNRNVPKVIYRADGTKRGFITAMLAPVNDRREHRFGLREGALLMTLIFGTVLLMRLLLVR